MSTSKKNQNKKVTDEAQQTKEKVMTKYDRKMAAYKEQQAQEAKERVVTNLIMVLVAALLIAFVASFPIRTQIAVNKTIFTLNGEPVKQVEYDYQYAVAKTNYLNQYGSYLSMFGITDLSSIESQPYTEDMTFGDYFQQLAVEGITNNRALLKEAQQEGFTYDTTEEYNELMDTLVSEAKGQDVTLKVYLQALFGKYASKARLKPVQENTLVAAAYYKEVEKRKQPAEDEIENYYKENKDDYDSVDYYLLNVDAELAISHIASEDYEGDEEPTEEEIAAAMEIAKATADEKMAVVAKEGELQENVTYDSCDYNIRSYLFDEGRKNGDTEIFEDSSNHRYQVVKFVKRYLSMQNTVDMYAIVVSEEENSQTILDDWKSKGATEDSFKALAKEYASKTSSTTEGFFEGIDASSLDEKLSAWLLDEGRKNGDTEAFTLEDGMGYVFYYVGTNKPVYYQNIKSTLTSKNMDEYMETLTRDANVQDPDENLAYLHVPTETAYDEAEELEVEEVEGEALDVEEPAAE